MAKGQDYTKYQRGVINRYYEHKDTIVLTRLQELVSELYLCTDAKKAAAMWKRVETALTSAGVSGARADKVLAEKDLKGLAAIIGELK